MFTIFLLLQKKKKKKKKKKKYILLKNIYLNGCFYFSAFCFSPFKLLSISNVILGSLRVDGKGIVYIECSNYSFLQF